MRNFSVYALAATVLAGLSACGGSDATAPVGAPPPPVTVTPEPPVPVTPPAVTPPPVTPPVTPEPPPVSPPPVTPPPVTPPPVTPPPSSLPPVLQVWNRCVAPRTGLDGNNFPYPDVQGTLDDERNFVRLWIDETYLWYKEVPVDPHPEKYATPVEYFAVLKTPLLTPSGRPKDRFHFTYTSAQWDNMSKGVTLGYGVSWARNADGGVPRIWRATDVVPGSVADKAGLRRGDQLLRVDGDDFVNGSGAELVARLNAGVFPTVAGATHRLQVARGAAALDVSLTAGTVSGVPVQNVKVIDTPAGKTGYLVFNDHIALSESQLIAAINTFKQAGVVDLVLDMRYNGGGQLNIASELAYMIAGPAATAGKTFELTVGNDKSKPKTPMLFRSTAVGYAAPVQAVPGQVLPYLGLKRVSVLTGPGTCSASESLINGLRGIDVEVNLIGEATCGKPYAFTAQPNCGITYFAIQYQGVNDKGFGDFADGFAPGCTVADDFEHAQGDPQEAVLAAALRYNASGVCTAPAPATARSATRAGAATPAMVPVRPAGKEISIR